jgi:hypothetical protein
MKRCELCGTPVKVVGHTTKHYEPIAEKKVSVKDIKRIIEITLPCSCNDGNGIVCVGCFYRNVLAKAIADYVNGGEE